MNKTNSTIKLLLMTGIIILFSGNMLVSQTQADELFKNGNRLYTEGKYREAIEDYKKVLQLGIESGELYYNLGNAYYKLREIGSSILYYEKAKRYLPDDEDLRNNLTLAHLQVTDRIDPIPEIFYKKFWNNLKDMFVLNSWSRIFFVFWFVTWILVSVIFLTRKRFIRKIVKLVLTFTIVFCFFSSLIVISLIYDYKGIKHAVVMTDEVKVYSGPDENETQLFLIHEGTKVRIKRRSVDWVEVKLANGNVGWILRNKIELI